ncbi:MAG: recombination regulator RecX [Acidobacteriota bacterium]|nr:recombination regulator RecX [Acidobacteriota bacterium]
MKDLKTTALNMLGRRENSRAQLRRKLLQRKFEPADIDQVLDGLTAAGFLDDARAAKTFARHASHIKGQGRNRIARELAAKGIDADLVSQTLDAQTDPDEEAGRLQAALARRTRGRDMTDRKESSKVWQALVRQGFSADAVSKALRHAGTREDE